VARSKRRGRDAPRLNDLLVLDADGVAKAASGDPSVQAWLERARELDADIVVSAVTLAELVRGAPLRDAGVNRVVKAADLWVADESLAREAGRLLGRTASQATIDALVAATALAARERYDTAQCLVLTSDPGDLSALIADFGGVRVLAV
jgi:predicted nucleic acid-binding protein